VYVARRLTEKKLEEIGKKFNMSNYATVSSVLCKISRQLQTNKALHRRITQLGDQLLKGQRQA
jgi:chromosomal replication initiation ATPase DnaA